MSKRKKQIARLDKLWHEAIIERDKGHCQKCGRPTDNPHHVIHRWNMGTRWLLENGINLCYETCHVPWAHAKPEEFMEWWRKRVGEKTYQLVKDKSRDIKIDLDQVEEYLKH